MVLKRRRPARTCPLLVMWTSGRPSASLRLCPQFRFTTCQRQTRDGTKSARPADLRRGRCKWNCPGNRFRSSPLDSSTGSRFIRNTVESSGSICGTRPVSYRRRRESILACSFPYSDGTSRSMRWRSLIQLVLCLRQRIAWMSASGRTGSPKKGASCQFNSSFSATASLKSRSMRQWQAA